jgi:DNA mismatch repair protein MutS2
LQQLRKDAEVSRQAALAAQSEAERTREVLAQRLAELQREADREVELVEARAQLKAGDRVIVPRLGYDRPGRVVKLDVRKKTAVVAIGHVTWNVDIDELIPQSTRGNETAPNAGGPGGRENASSSKQSSRLGGRVGPLERFPED